MMFTQLAQLAPGRFLGCAATPMQREAQIIATWSDMKQCALIEEHVQA